MFVRIELASPAFADLGENGFDTRFKVILPGPTGALPAIPPVPEDFYENWLATPDDVRSPMRTYTVGDISSARTTRCGWWWTSSYTRTWAMAWDPPAGGRSPPSPVTWSRWSPRTG